jgi:NADP-dependent 3-hydroxy acid dehydrogenase YdfG
MSGVTLVELDVKDDNSVRSAVQSILQKEQRIDALVNNAGLALTGSIEETTIEDASGEPGGSLTLAPSPD